MLPLSANNPSPKIGLEMMEEPEEITPNEASSTHSLGLRLRRIEGQIRGIARMLENDRSCEDVITQLLAIRSAMDRVAAEVVHIHIDRCLRDMPPEEAQITISRIVDLLSK